MGGEQAALRDNFSAFVNNLDAANAARASAGLEPIDFHLAVTTTSVFWNEESTSLCRNDCPGAVGQPVCCTSSTPDRKPLACGGPTGACPEGSSCRLDCNGFRGEFTCCSGPANAGVPALTELVPCSAARVGTMCGTLATHYDLRGCGSRVAPADFWPYPAGDFVSFNNGLSGGAMPTATPNPRVVHFDKELYTSGLNRQGYGRQQLIDFFTDNVQVGVCGSGQEQALEAAYLAVKKALEGQQKDTRDATGAVAWTVPSATQLPGSAPARWPNPNSKLVLVFVGDEDDCSSDADPSGGVVWTSDPAANDACQRDSQETTPAAIRNKQFAIQKYVSYFTGLGRPVAAAFILPAAQNSCTLASCTTTGLCCGEGATCSSTVGAQSAGHRLLATAHALSQAGVEVVAGSVCDGNFASLLDQVAEIVKPPSGLELPTMPAENQVTLLRIASASGQTRKICGEPLPPGSYASVADAQATGADWWFGDPENPDPSRRNLPVALSQFVYINPRGSCIANPGETYSADYLGRLPEGGCRSDAQCQTTLGGAAGSWTCFAGVASDGVCLDPATSVEPGTCLCGPRSNNCPNG
jgi:hypothetical protein